MNKRAVQRGWTAFRQALVCGYLLTSLTSSAQPAAEDYRALNQALLTQHVLPRYQMLATTAASLAADTAAACADGRVEDAEMTRLQTAYGDASDAWQSIQHVRFGPAELFMRGTRLAFWPDPRGAADSQLRALLQSGDPARLAPDRFADNGVAVQGFPALERLLFADSSEVLASPSAEAAYRCQVLTAMTRGISDMTAGLAADWRSFVAELEAGDGAGGFYETPAEVTLDLFKSLYTSVELAADHKLARAIGTRIEDARPQQTEAWRSQRSLSNIRLNLAAGAAMFGGEAAAVEGGPRFADLVDNDLRVLLSRAFRQTLATAESLPAPLEVALTDPDHRPQVEKLLREMLALKTLLAQRLPPALGIPLGFNALDGD
ncbi:MAG: imelysin family protein [Spongiibacteraceae bacterium]|jgi:predicted lipoprotein|nr:imelysin family protein [Spongiibacteraceae bacterium]